MKSKNTTRKGQLRLGMKLGKYRIERRITNGPFASVYQAYDSIEGIRVALKIPNPHVMDDQFLADFRKEVRLSAKLDHPNILYIKNAGFIGHHFVIVTPLGERTLHERLQRRIALRTTLDYLEQALDALTYAHSQRIIHCDIKPENFILFPGDHLRLADFGIAKMAMRTVEASGSGTVGYVAPEQAMGRPSFKSDIFSLGLILYRMLSGHLPTWPFEWPPPGYEKIRKRIHPDLIALVKKAMDLNPAHRYEDAGYMWYAFMKIKSRVLAYSALKRSAQQRRRKRNTRIGPDWQEVRWKQFRHNHGRELETRFECRRCGGPVSEPMLVCPWCGTGRKAHRDETRFPARCPRCKRGIKLDWKYCPWCYGPQFKQVSTRAYTDVRYQARCAYSKCSRKSLMPFMHWCPWCHRKVQRSWKISGSQKVCPSCKWGILPRFWSYCPWCGKRIVKR